MPGPKFGLQFIQVDDQPTPVYGANLDVVGIIGPCSTASAAAFPINTPVIRFSNDLRLSEDLGNDGYILDAIEGINDQLADFEIADNDGATLVDEAIEVNGATGLFATLPLRAIEQALLAGGIPARLSSTAGTFLCNATLYSLMRIIERPS